MSKDFAKIFRTKEYGQVLLQSNDDYSIIWIIARVGGRLLKLEISQTDGSSLENSFNKMRIKDIYEVIDEYIGFDRNKIILN
ncbi:hypothetical protein KC717_04540 [Candidatus Dojkabacteria bacterium]|uniref:Uncharacterized protein n=1 Tax=Candidatus Dojkabacteria bacterium TaxID=2099670 RepID=A0A955RKX2_9BACT|nr:hypothetical protein [Candidatus Dojkabacteria bacterium]